MQGISDIHAFPQSAVRYWERRRIIYNVALALPALFGFAFTDMINWAGDSHPMHWSYILAYFALSAVGANICYSFAYGLEFLFGSDDPASSWLRFGRTAVFVSGVLFAMLLALIGGYQIAQIHWNYGFKHIGELFT